MLTGAPYGQIFEPTDLGCSGGKSLVSGSGGRGGGTIYLNVTKELQNDGEISCNGEPGTGASGGGSGGSILIDVHNIKVLNDIEKKTEIYLLNGLRVFFLLIISM